MEIKDRRARVYELVTVDGADAIARVDCRVHGYSEAKFLRENSATYYVAINSWLLQFKEYTRDGWYDVLSVLLRDGLISTVTRFSAAADELVHESPVSDSVVADILSRVRLNPLLEVASLPFRPNKLAICLQLCRYLKRMTIRERADVRDKAIGDFESTQQWLGSLAEFGVDKDLCRNAAELLQSSLPWEEITARIRKMGPRDRTFTTGASADAGGLFENKLIRLASVEPGFFRPIMGSWLTTPPSQTEDPEWLTDSELVGLWRNVPEFPELRHRHTVRISTAPKSIKGPRIIAMEPVRLQMAQRYVKDILYQYLPDGCALTDQEQNRQLAAEGANNGTYATIDLHAASDYVTKQLVWEIFPQEFLRAIWWMVPSHYQVGKSEEKLLHSFATMGNGLTFWIESLTFWAIASSVSGPGNAFVYGDDIIVPTKDAASVVGLLRRLGFVVNQDKTFITGQFRESCGYEAMGSYPVASTYYPRFPVVGEITEHTCSFSDFSHWDWTVLEDCTMKLVQLQHRLWDWCEPAARFIAAVVQDAHPRMTYSKCGSESPDLWGYCTVAGPTDWAPAASFVQSGPQVEGAERQEAVSKQLIDIPRDNLPKAALRETHYAPRPGHRRELSEQAGQLLAHYLYWEFLEKGPRPWQEGDGWLPNNAYLPRNEAMRLIDNVVVWGCVQT